MKEDMMKQVQSFRFTIQTFVFAGLLFSSAQPVYAEEISPEVKQEASRLQSRFSNFYNKLKHFSRCARGKEQCSSKEKNVLRASVGAAGFLLFLGLTTIGYRLTIRSDIAAKNKFIEESLSRLELQFKADKQELGTSIDFSIPPGSLVASINERLTTIPQVLDVAKQMDNENLAAKNERFDEIVNMIRDIESDLADIREYLEKNKK